MYHHLSTSRVAIKWFFCTGIPAALGRQQVCPLWEKSHSVNELELHTTYAEYKLCSWQNLLCISLYHVYDTHALVSSCHCLIVYRDSSFMSMPPPSPPTTLNRSRDWTELKRTVEIHIPYHSFTNKGLWTGRQYLKKTWVYKIRL